MGLRYPDNLPTINNIRWSHSKLVKKPKAKKLKVSKSADGANLIKKRIAAEGSVSTTENFDDYVRS